MRRIGILLLVLVGCVSGPSAELVMARRAVADANASQASTYARNDLLRAEQALTVAEIAYQEAPGSVEEIHYAYLATQRAQLATANARAAYQLAAAREAARASKAAELARKNQQIAERDRQLAERRRRLQAQESQIDQQQTQLDQQAEALRAEREARENLQRERDAALAKLKEFALVIETERGIVITLGGALLFRTDEAVLLPTATAKLDQVAVALHTIGNGESLVIEGHADSRGSSAENRLLSTQRAEAVRAYLVTRGVAPEQLVAVGKGEDQPVASNATAEGRANNRRVEIVISRTKSASVTP